jgi:hypothetical protein
MSSFWPTGRAVAPKTTKRKKQTTSWLVAPEAVYCKKSRPVAGLEFSDCKAVVPARVIPSHKIPLEIELLMFLFFHVCECADCGLPGSDSVQFLNMDAIVTERQLQGDPEVLSVIK